MNIQYGSINCEVKWQWPTIDIFRNWLGDFFEIPGADKFEIYIVGRFVDVMFGDPVQTSDVDVILIGNHDLKEIEEVMNESTRIGMEKYNVFFDVLWFDKLPIYANMKPEDKSEVTMYLVGNQWIEDGVVKKEYTTAEKISDKLWKYKATYPNHKQLQRINRGYQYRKPIKIEKQ